MAPIKPMIPDTMMPSFYGEAVQWECDELGHLNMRHYMTKAHQARQFFFMNMGLSEAFQTSADSTVRTRTFMVRYLKESRPGARLKMSTGITKLRGDTADLLHIMTHHDGTVSAVITETVEHLYLRTGEPFDWPKRLREAAKAHMTQPPVMATARGLPTEPATGPNRYALKSGGASFIGAGVFQPVETDQFQSVMPQALLGRITESIGNFEALWPEVHASRASGDSTSAALLEIRGHVHHWATTGKAYELYSAAQSANAYTRLAAHHIVDPISGENWASFSASGCLFDLDSRKLVKTPEAQIDALNAMSLPDLRA